MHLSSLGKSTTSLLKHSIMGADDTTLLSFVAAFEDIARAASKCSDGGRVPKMSWFAKCPQVVLRISGHVFSGCLPDSILISPIRSMASLFITAHNIFLLHYR